MLVIPTPGAAGNPLHGRAIARNFAADDVLKKWKGNCNSPAHDKRQRGVKPVQVQEFIEQFIATDRRRMELTLQGGQTRMR